MTQHVCVASVPAGHPYVERVLASSEIHVLADPKPTGASDGQWWPPVILTPGWIEAHRDDARILHLHFGFESFTPGQLEEVVVSARRVGWPIVLTVHDLINPQLVDQEPDLERLDVMVPAADAVITLTSGAARAIAKRWGREALVLPHPRLLVEGVESNEGLGHDTPIVGVHLKDLRPNVDGPLAVRTLAGALDHLIAAGTPAVGEVHLHRQVRDVAQREVVRALCETRDDLVLLEHDRFDDASLAHSLAHLDVCLLPYRTGTHSGWLELCWDLGLAVAAPSVGYFDQQHDDPTVATFDWDEDGSSLATTLGGLLAIAPRAGSEARRREVLRRLELRAVRDDQTASAHLDLYRSLLAAGATA